MEILKWIKRVRGCVEWVKLLWIQVLTFAIAIFKSLIYHFLRETRLNNKPTHLRPIVYFHISRCFVFDLLVLVIRTGLCIVLGLFQMLNIIR